MIRDLILGILILLAVLFFVRRDTRERVSMTEKYNHLVHEKSPYLLQHKDNPVNWYAWGEEAFETARKENKPIFLSIGYSTCHWCHVMEHDSFERQDVADVLNKLFISIKVDREERPDVDEIYMAAIHAMGQRGGWPLSMFLTPDLKPFYGGTYWPREQFVVILERLAQIWREQPEKVFDSGDQVLEFVRTQKTAETEIGSLNEKVFSDFFRHSTLTFDPRWGGFGAAPKFPHPMQLSILLRIHRRTGNPEALEMAQVTLDKMARGGMYDHLGGGFARYSTDERWLVPHFEKMLYDNALLAKSYLEAYQITKNEMFAAVAREILDYVLRDMTHPEGGFYSAEDADSEGEEGKFYVWTEEELKKLLSTEEFEIFSKVYGVTPEGNFEHHTNIISLQPGYEWKDKKNPLVQSASQKLFSIREKRIRPHRDDKILTSWNGLMISAMALGYQVLGDQRYLDAAEKAADFILHRSGLREGPNLKARYRDGQARFPAYLDDYAFLIQGILDLYECRFDEGLLKTVIELQNRQGELFWDSKNGGFFFTDGTDKSLLVRSKEGIDSALPNGNAVSALNLIRLHDLTLQAPYREGASKIFRVFSKMVGQYPHAFSQMLIAYDYFIDSSKEIAVIAPTNDSAAEEFLKSLRKTFSPNKAIAQGGPGRDFPGLLKEKTLLNDKTTFYVCEDQTCKKPTNDPAEAVKFVQEYRPYKLNLGP